MARASDKSMMLKSIQEMLLKRKRLRKRESTKKSLIKRKSTKVHTKNSIKIAKVSNMTHLKSSVLSKTMRSFTITLLHLTL